MPISGPNHPDNEVDTAATVQDSDQDSGRTVLELRTAARFLNTSPDALRKRIKRGSAQGYKEDGRWWWTPWTDRPDRTGQTVRTHPNWPIFTSASWRRQRKPPASRPSVRYLRAPTRRR